MDDRKPPPSSASMALATLAFIVGALLTLPGFGIGLCSVMLPVFPEWLVRISVTIAIFGTLLVAWALWRMMR